MGKITKYFGQTIFSQIFSLIPLKEIISIISNGGYDKYTKKFNSIDHFITLLYGVLKGFDSLREIINDLSINEKRLKKAGLSKAPSRSTISDANNRRSASFFGNVYSILYGLYANFLSNISDSGSQKWLRLLHVIDSTTITLFSSILKGVGRNPISGKKKGGIKSHCIMRYYANVPFFVRFTSAATHDSVMNNLIDLATGSIIAMDRAYIDYALFERFTSQGVIYVTKMKKSLTYFSNLGQLIRQKINPLQFIIKKSPPGMGRGLGSVLSNFSRTLIIKKNSRCLNTEASGVTIFMNY